MSYCCDGIKTALAEGIVEFDDAMEHLYAGNMELAHCPCCGQKNIVKTFVREGRDL